MHRRLRPLIPLLVCAAALTSAPAALAHAQLLGTVPASGATVARQPPVVVFKFNQNVGGTLGAVRVYDAQGHEVDDLDVSHPQGRESWMGVGLRVGLPDGTYTATYRVISADTHIVYGGLVFNIGHAGAAPRFTVAGLIERGRSGQVTAVAFGAVRALDYITIALLIGGLAFLLGVWPPAFAEVQESTGEWSEASLAFVARGRRLLMLAATLGLTASVLGILLQGASAAGVSLWSSIEQPILENTLQSRFGEVWGLRALDWLALGVLLASPLAQRGRPQARGGSAGTGNPPWWLAVALGLGAAYMAATPALSGHASVESPTAVFFASDVLHVLGASVWVGGIACLLFALPSATGRLEHSQRTRLLAATLRRFSPLALACVIAIALTGVLQAYIDVRSLHALLHSAYGALILVKTVLLLALIAVGWVNRRRVIPGLTRLLADGLAPGAVGVLARRTMRGELALMLGVLAVTAALVGYAPPVDVASGPFSASTTLGAAELEMTVEPARIGPNTIHLYLIDARTGSPFTATRELVAKALLPAKGIGPLALTVNAAGPGHYVLSSADLSPGGTWEIQITDRVSEFEESTRSIRVPIE
jgi:copper transport protein